MIKLYELILTDEESLAVVYDICRSGIVAAETEDDARRIMSDIAWDEGRQAWISPERSTCMELKIESLTEGVIIADFMPG